MGKFVGIGILASITATLLYAGFYKTHTHEKKNNYLLNTHDESTCVEAE